ncbi:hypothetical protein DP939_08155 [Spongiactinospora rosea]|uniref:Uncharacterized protein n=1 Tax=Spongiactinospora rosea TaxID=2248750 RepID=A0A366M4P9_9ACTN|nr:hypothetical protein DP939_08155 [Spongiactinospora rosea]
MLVTAVSGVIALTGGDPRALLLAVTHLPIRTESDLPWWDILLLVLIAAGQGWALWQILRGPVAGERPVLDRNVRLLRWALYLNAALAVIAAIPGRLPDWLDIAGLPAGLALVVLFFRALDGAPATFRVGMLLIGVLAKVTALGAKMAGALDATALAGILGLVSFHGVPWVVWTILALIAQARDGRWSRGVVWVGAASTGLAPFSLPLVLSFELSSIVGIDLLVPGAGLYALANVLTVAWYARSAHEAGAPRRAKPAPTAPPRKPIGRRLPALVAIVLPLIPAAVNLAHGVPTWIGPEWALPSGYQPPLMRLWQAADVLVGVGGMAVLVLVTVVRRTLRQVRVTAAVLFAAAGLGSIAALTTAPRPVGVSPLWYGAAFVAAALVLVLQYGGGPAYRTRSHVIASVTAASLALCFLPAGDLAAGPVTTQGACPAEYDPARPLTGERAYLCDLRRSKPLPALLEVADRAALRYGRALCGVFSRNDPAELARAQRADGLDVRRFAGTLAPICPSAQAIVAADRAAEEIDLWLFQEAERQVCARAPRHRPRIEPVTAIRQPEPVYTDYGSLVAYEPEITEDPLLTDPPYRSGVLSGGPGVLSIDTYTDPPLCVTTETYTRRPPVETKGWEHVAEAGFHNLSGEIRFADAMGGTPLPDLAVRGKGRYRIRVHYSWIRQNGDNVGQRLLIMAFPGRGDDLTVHAKSSDSP